MLRFLTQLPLLPLFEANAPPGAAPAAGPAPAPPPAAAPGGPAASPAAGGTAPASEPELPPNMQEAFNKRLGAERAKLEKELRASVAAEIQKQHETDIRLAEYFRKQGYDPREVLTQWEQAERENQARQMGTSPDVLQKLQHLEQQVTTFTQRDRVTALNAEATALQAEPGFDAALSTHGQAALDRAMQSGETLEQALMALAGRQILAARDQAAEQRALAQAAGRAGKMPAAAVPGPGAIPSTNVWDLPKEQFDKIVAEVKAGKRRAL